jgi:iron complex outermembrane receptor protein
MKKNLISFRILILFVAWAFAFQAYAQDIQVSGKVSDAKDGLSLPGATVQVKGTTNGTLTDIDGKYSLKVKSGSVLSFSFIGYDAQEVTVTSANTINIALKQSSTTLEQVVVIGYGQVKKSDATGSINVLGSKDFNRGAITSPQDLLVGKSAGVVITTSGGAPGAGATIRIRGGSSLSASNDPLIIIDGVPIDNTNVSGSSNALSFVNPNDIESFTVLKDASATAIYGSRASNGVIIITTKKGVAGSPMKLTYNGSASLAVATALTDVYSGDQIRKIAFDYKDLYSAESFSRLGNENTDWQKEIFRTAISQDHNIGITGAVKTMPYRVSVGYTGQEGILKNTDMQRVTGSVSLNPTFFNNSLKVNVNAKGMNTNNNFGADGAIGSSIAMDPSHPVKDGSADYDGYFQWNNYGSSLGTPNPVEQALAADNKSVVNRFMGNIQMDYTLPFFKDIRANLNLATDYSKSEGHNNRPTTSPSNLTNPFWGKLNDYNSTSTNNLLDFYVNYQKELTGISSKIDATAGYSWQRFGFESFSYTRGNYDADHKYQPATDSATYTKPDLQLVSFFGRLNYTLMDRYLFTFTMRDDGSSRFHKDKRWGLFPSVAFAWKLKEESFLKSVDAISDLKLRIGWGITGQQDIGDNPLPYMALYEASVVGSYYMIDGKYIPTLRPKEYDPFIKWEETTTKNIGLDFGFLNGKISGSFDLYNRVTEDLINTITIPTGSNFNNTLTTNIGSLENKGFEFSLNLIAISTEDQSLNLGFNVGYNKNTITKLLLSDDPNYIGILYGDGMTGSKQVTRVGYPAYSFFVNEQIYDANGNPIEGLYTDLSGEGGTVNGDNNDKYLYHNPAPDYLMGFSVRYNYKSFDFAASTRASIGNYVYNQVAATAAYDQMYQVGYWHNMPTFLDDTKFVTRQFTSDYFVENASFFKLDNISVGYKFDKIYKKLNGRIGFTVQNALTVTKYTGLDPEVSSGIDNNFYPRPRTFMVSLSLGY